MTAFCDPPMSTSTPHPSISMCVVPRPVMASTTSTASLPLCFNTSATPATSWRTPVEVSYACMITARVSILSALRTSSRSKVWPYGALTTSTSHPNAFARPTQRPPNLPACCNTSTPAHLQARSGSSRRVPIAPVPEEASSMTSFLVPTKVFRSAEYLQVQGAKFGGPVVYIGCRHSELGRRQKRGGAGSKKASYGSWFHCRDKASIMGV